MITKRELILTFVIVFLLGMIAAIALTHPQTGANSQIAVSSAQNGFSCVDVYQDNVGQSSLSILQCGSEYCAIMLGAAGNTQPVAISCYHD